MYPLRILPAGDAALLVSLPQIVDPEQHAWCVSLADRLRASTPAVTDVVVGYCTVTIYFDPLSVDADKLEQHVRRSAETLGRVRPDEGGLLEVPVCYGGEFGPDLADVAAFCGCSEAEVIARHSARTYRVYVIGFVPGFAYMATVDPGIAAPRRAMPRTAVPPGSVAIAGSQTGIYPAETPGGWNIIGRTPVKPFEAGRTPPFLFNAGDRVRFQPVSADAFVAAAAKRT
jgi:inhibitor of KinA